MVPPDDEQVWIRRACAGDHQAYGMLVERYQSRLYRVVAHLLGPDYAGIDDVTQDVLVRAFFSLARFRCTASFGTWLIRIAINRCRDEQRRLSSKRVLEQRLVQQAAHTPADCPVAESHVEDADALPSAIGRVVQEAVAALPEKLRLVITLKDLEGYSYEEVGRMLRCSIGTVKSRHARGRKKLRQLLAPHVPGLKQGGAYDV